MDNILDIKQVKKISSSAKHCAFTDLINNPFSMSSLQFLCCYREAEDHVSMDGVIRIQKLTQSLSVIGNITLKMTNTDLRDPKFVFNGERLIVTAYAKSKFTDKPGLNIRMVSFYSDNGDDWNEPVVFSQSDYWIWRSTWHKNTAYGFGYKRADEQLNIYRGDPTSKMTLLAAEVLSLDKHEAGYPNESHILFDSTDNANAIVRRDADSYSAKLGFSKPPYTDWHWKDLGIYIGGPAMTVLAANFFLVAGRDWDEKDDDKLTTKIWLLDTKVPSLTEMLTLPSAGDNSYPGLCVVKDTAYLSYYSSHEDDQTSVYCAEICGLDALLDVIEQT
ncbi:hypothetical protein [Alteromonas sp. KUL49]|uniref:hypothetical protein n=1 Tax=Alteromonas sp. KUL49 TaxID=2480798 RepID=UPI00102EF6A5|nr:hypothetical protein [Alteromonas sp. KUL49]TAP39659.1 hypothetical protein EYS00_10020 [Alteromonas sp. KUL49]GEA11644.1 hypothetical protein KUL49_20190 [Alteromonas sp. KUL49]